MVDRLLLRVQPRFPMVDRIPILCLLALSIVIHLPMMACSSAEEADEPFEGDSVPPILDDIRSGGSSADEDFISSLVVNLEDLPPGFVQDLEETTDLDGTSLYVSKYFNREANDDDLLSGHAISSVEIQLFVFESVSEASSFFVAYKGLSAEELIASAEGGAHHPVGPEFEGLETVEVSARELTSPMTGESVAWQIWEHVLDHQSGEEAVFYNVSLTFRTNRAVGTVDFGSLTQAAAMGDVAPLAEAFRDRLERGLQQ